MPDSKAKPSKTPNFLTCPVPGLEASVNALNAAAAPAAPAPKVVPFEPLVRVGSEKPLALPKQDPSASSGQAVGRGTSVVGASHDPRPTTHDRATKKKPRPLHWVFIAIVLAVLIAVGPATVSLGRAGWSAQLAKTSLALARTNVEQQNYAAAARNLDDTKRHLTDAREALKAMGFWRDVPTVGTQVRALEDAASAGATTVDGMRDLLLVAGSLFDAALSASEAAGEITNPVEAHRSFKDLSPEEKRAILSKLDRALPDIKAAQAKVSVALETWNRIPQNALFAPLKKAFQPVAENLPRLKRSLDEAVPLLELFIPLAGYPKPVEYLVLLQNSDEMRATGGFLGTWGILQMDGGDLKSFTFNDVYSLDNPASGVWKETPPAPLRDRIPAPNWFFRDANWSPDFPTSAEKLSDFYVRETYAGTGKTVNTPDGVIAMNAPFFEGLLRMTGPMTIDGVTFTADNFFDELEYEVEQRFLQKGVAIEDRKQILIKLGDALIEKVTSLPASRWPDFLDLATRALDRKQIQVFARDPAVLARLDAAQWSGRAKSTEGDFLWVVDSNVSALKTDGVVRKRVAYTVNATDPENITATVTLRYSNDAPGFQEYRYTRYRDYVRLYVPEGARLISSSGAMKDDRYRTGGRFVAGPVDVYKELGKTVFGAFWSIEPKTTQDITFTYALPASVVEKGRYRLDVPKQSGNDDVELTLDLRFGKNLQHATPSEEPTQFGDANYRITTDSTTDREFDISL